VDQKVDKAPPEKIGSEKNIFHNRGSPQQFMFSHCHGMPFPTKQAGLTIISIARSS